MTRYVATIVGLTLGYALALGSFHPLDLLFGAGLSATLVGVSRRFVFGDEPGWGPSFLRRVAAFVPFSFAVFWQVVAGTWEVTLVTLHLRPLRSPGIVEVSIGERTPAGVAVWAVVSGLAPGTFFVDVDGERRVVLIHVIDAGDPEAFRRKEEDFYRRYQRRVFP
jgi:multisubunit Na+/H+ antiporter MnhE subunit